MKVPLHMPADRNGFVFVVDVNNYRVLLLSPMLTYVRALAHLNLSAASFKCKPSARLSYAYNL